MVGLNMHPFSLPPVFSVALYSSQTPREFDCIDCQSHIPFPSPAATRSEPRGALPTVPTGGDAGGSLYGPVGWQSTRRCYPVSSQLQQVLLETVVCVCVSPVLYLISLAVMLFQVCGPFLCRCLQPLKRLAWH